MIEKGSYIVRKKSFNKINCWSNIRLSRHFTPKLKFQIDDRETNGAVYQFECFCKKTYIGESKRPLYKRIYEHNRLRTSSIYQHISECNLYLDQLHKKYGLNPSIKNKRDFIEERFEILSTNNVNYFKRTRIEGLAISLFKPELNDQNNFHKKLHNM